LLVDCIVDEQMYAEESGAGAAVIGVRHELRDRASCVRDHDLLALPHARQQM
jgi:hypothetical protein